MSRKAVIIDTDVGVDDALALILALHSNELDVRAITTVCGNVNVDQATLNLQIILDFLEEHRKEKIFSKPILAKGSAKPLKKDLVSALEVHGYDGLGGATFLNSEDGATLKYPLKSPLPTLDAVDTILTLVEQSHKEGNPISIITLGPLTNIAKAIQRNLEVMKLTKEIVIMGGAFDVYGNVTLTAEYNIWVDPHATEVVLTLDVPLIFVPLNVTMQVFFGASIIEKYTKQPGAHVAKFVDDISKQVFEFQMEDMYLRGIHMHDPLAVAVSFCQSWLIPSLVHTHVVVECDGKHTSGMTIGDVRSERLPLIKNKNAYVCTQVDADGFLNMFTERVLKE